MPCITPFFTAQRVLWLAGRPENSVETGGITELFSIMLWKKGSGKIFYFTIGESHGIVIIGVLRLLKAAGTRFMGEDFPCLNI